MGQPVKVMFFVPELPSTYDTSLTSTTGSVGVVKAANWTGVLAPSSLIASSRRL